MPLNYTKRQWLILFIMGLSDFFNAICVSLQAPFFPQEAEAKGATATEYGLVFGVFELVVCLSSPLYGKFLNRIGPKAMFNGGVFTTGTSAILFGLLDRAPGHTSFITLAFIIRIVEALGNAAFLTASFTIIASEFPNNVGSSFATLETFFGLGLIVGPMVGGVLYSAGGYYLPFVVLGSALFACAVMTLLVLPVQNNDRDENANQGSLIDVLKIPGIQVCAFGIIATSASIGFISATLEPHLRIFNLTAIFLGVMFVINGGVYALSAPFVGYCIDKCKTPKIASILGSIFIIIGFSLIGPATFIPLDTTLSLVIIGLIFHGMGIAILLVSTFSDALRTAVQNGFDDGIETYGLISGLWTSTFALGAFIGPSISGYLFDKAGFRNSVYFIIVLHILVVLIFTCFITCFSNSNKKSAYKELSSDDKIIGKSNGSLHKGRQSRSGSISSSTHYIPVPMAMNNNMVIASSYGKSNHWQRLEEANLGLLADMRDDAYGSIEHEIHRETIA
ncbi:hypothetical protein PVAND_012162 [Polypedilum vanderplanki]|uniref:Major facilitator superfamily (MFS) profile domain-containing protein n=1 Tax=Polypedilum vanderplanki TaxID=319348 RepID=A0A9J6CLL2_POLVA|nr:hypothetical protein PVAND_012162 [Polypedilum vanderplanki]